MHTYIHTHTCMYPSLELPIDGSQGNAMKPLLCFLYIFCDGMSAIPLSAIFIVMKNSRF